MSKFRKYTQESRQQILHATTNQSTSKQAWTFSKQKRFIMLPPNCPNISYNSKLSTCTNRQTSFGSLQRKVFTEVTAGPSSWVYNPNDRNRTKTVSFGYGREEVISNSYIMRDPLKNPGPGRYQSIHMQSRPIYTMRPKTANHRNYFIDDKQLQAVPGPGKYQDQNSKLPNKSLISKFKSITLGASITNKQKRFLQLQQKTPSSWQYNQGNIINQMGRKTCTSKIGSAQRKSFIDQVKKQSYTPGPGNYKLPTEFAHYKKITFL